MARDAYLECGKIINTHGFRGDIKLESWCDTPKVLAGLGRIFFRNGNDYCEVRVTSASVFRQFVLMHLAGTENEEAANRLRGTVVYAAREDIPLPVGGFFLADLTGLPVIDADSGEVLGTLREVIHPGASDIYVVKRPGKEDAMIPAVPEFIRRVDTEKGVFVTPIGGMLDDDETV